MKKNIFFLFIISFFILSCSNTKNSNYSSKKSNNEGISSSIIKTKNYKDYSEYIINLNDMYNQKDNIYGVYFYSEYCPACASLKELLFKFLDSENKCIDNLYLVDIGTTNEEDFNKLQSSNGLFEEEIRGNNIGATSIETTYFRTSPCIYFISKTDSINSIFEHYINYQDVYDFLNTNNLQNEK